MRSARSFEDRLRDDVLEERGLHEDDHALFQLVLGDTGKSVDRNHRGTRLVFHT